MKIFQKSQHVGSGTYRILYHEVTGEPAQMGRLAIAFTARIRLLHIQVVSDFNLEVLYR